MAVTGECYAVFLHDSSMEALGDAITPYLRDDPRGRHVCCRAVDTAGGFVEMTIDAQTDDGSRAEVEVIVPSNMVKLIVSMRSDGVFGFAVRGSIASGQLPVVGPGAPLPKTPSTAVPDSGGAADLSMDDARRPPEG